MNIPLYWRFFLPFALTLLIATAAGWWISTTIVAQAMEDRVAAHTSATAATLARGEFPLTEILLKRTAELLDVGIILVGPDGQPAFTTLPSLNGAAELLAGHIVGPSEAETPPFVAFSGEGTPFMVGLLPLSAQRDTRYAAVAIAASLADVKRTAQSIAVWMGAAALLGMLAIAGVGHLLARGITLPLLDLSDMAGRIASGDRSARVSLDKRDEVGNLARALNEMADTLAKYERTVADSSRLAAMGEMAARMAHEIRNPLTAIKLHVQILLEGAQHQQVDSLQTVLNEVRRLELVVASTLDLSRQAQLIKRLCNLNTAVTECIELVAAQFGHCRINIEPQLAADLPSAWLDADKVKQVLLNLLNNAADELPSGGTVRVRTFSDTDAERIVLQVDDSGPGLSSDVQSRLFSPQASKKPSGLGIGLSLCKELVELHGGSIEAGNGDLGGAQFVIYFPLGSE